MIKVIAFDLIGVLIRENDRPLNNNESKIEKTFSSNPNDIDYLKVNDHLDNVSAPTKTIIDNIYDVRDKNLFKTIKELYPAIKIAIASNHISFIRDFIYERFGHDFLDEVFISAEIGMVKPNCDYYKYILEKFNIKPEELLFLDDSQLNVDGAAVLGINTIKINDDSLILKEVINFLTTHD